MNGVDVVFPARAAAAAAPVVCILHCLAAPALVVVAPVLAESRWVELGLMGASLAAGLGLACGGVRRHGDRRIWIPVLVAAALFAGGWAGVFEEAAEPLAAVGGGLAILAALAWDAHLRRSCGCKGCGCLQRAEDRATS